MSKVVFSYLVFLISPVNRRVIQNPIVKNSSLIRFRIKPGMTEGLV